MNLLLDTHIFMWWAIKPHKLSPIVYAALQNQQNTLTLSVVSMWEMQIKDNAGRLTLPIPVKTFIQTQTTDNNIQILPVLERHIWALKGLPFFHKDPFDRLLAAQTIVEQYKLVTADRALMKYPISLLT